MSEPRDVPEAANPAEQPNDLNPAVTGTPEETTRRVIGDDAAAPAAEPPENPAEETTEERPEQFYEDAAVPNVDVPPEGAATDGDTLPEAHGPVGGATAAELGSFAAEVAGPLPDEDAPPAGDDATTDSAGNAAEAAADQPDTMEDASDEGASGDAVSDESASEDEEEPELEPVVGFDSLGLGEPILRAIAEAGYVTPTPIQEQAIPVVLMGRDVLGCAQTGTGKTAGFTLPMLDILAGSRAKARMPRSLILEPTRELALQVAENFVKYGKHLNLVHALLIGGESMNDQRAVLDKGVDVLIATPGRLLDLFERGRILLADCKILVIDEADRMLDMGFIPDVERIVSMLPPLRQTLFFSATMAPEIRKLADAFLQNPKEITVSRPASVATTITTGLVLCQPNDKREALRRLIRSEDVQNALIFCNRKRDVDILYKSLSRHGFSVGALHGDMDQSARFATLAKFKNNELRLLVCSDVAARGLDIGGLSHVFNFDVPFHSEDYVHRIGRTGRAGREGKAFTIATADDAKLVAAVEKLTGAPIPRMEVPGLEAVDAAEVEAAARSPRGGRGRREGGRDERSRGRGAPRGEARGREGAEERSRTSPDERVRGGTEERSRGPEEFPRRGEPSRRSESSGRGDRGEARPRSAGRSDFAAEPAPREPAGRDNFRSERPRGEDASRGRGRSEERAPRSEERPAPRYEDRQRREYRDRNDDLGPAVRGFGDSVPAFMLIPIPRPRRTEEGPTGPDAEAA
ncbi:DEAD/DEAH box helicase [Roseomonas sp. BN140053]|uniref:DEAD/DEAH box helicase n=1 Tax=Roseomonas sp. BN140053 TaxID=3391898 RepID=UPI0039E98891